MLLEVVPLTREHLDKLLGDRLINEDEESYFSPGSVALCLMRIDKEKRIDLCGEYPRYFHTPVFAGGIVNLKWNRGEAWILPTPFFRSHVKTCLRELRDYIPSLAKQCGFRRVQATCVQGVSAKLFMHLGFEYEGTMKHFGPNGETCSMYSRIMVTTP